MTRIFPRAVQVRRVKFFLSVWDCHTHPGSCLDNSPASLNSSCYEQLPLLAPAYSPSATFAELEDAKMLLPTLPTPDASPSSPAADAFMALSRARNGLEQLAIMSELVLNGNDEILRSIPGSICGDDDKEEDEFPAPSYEALNSESSERMHQFSSSSSAIATLLSLASSSSAPIYASSTQASNLQPVFHHYIPPSNQRTAPSSSFTAQSSDAHHTGPRLDSNQHDTYTFIHRNTNLSPITVGKKRKRANSDQLDVLNRVFEEIPFPTNRLRTEIAVELKMETRSVQVWFQNRRQSLRAKNKGQAKDLDQWNHQEKNRPYRALFQILESSIPSHNSKMMRMESESEPEIFMEEKDLSASEVVSTMSPPATPKIESTTLEL